MFCSKRDLEDLKNEVRREVVKELRKDEDVIRDICLELVADIFNDDRDSKTVMRGSGWHWYADRVKTVKGKFKEEALALVHTDVERVCQAEALKVVEGETFLDRLVERFRAKQL